MIPGLRVLPSGFVYDSPVEKPQLSLQIIYNVRQIGKLRVSLLPENVPKPQNALNDGGLRCAIDLVQNGVV
eukprot:12979555-Heterocapsa_arctica.AAC.1